MLLRFIDSAVLRERADSAKLKVDRTYLVLVSVKLVLQNTLFKNVLGIWFDGSSINLLFIAYTKRIHFIMVKITLQASNFYYEDKTKPAS